MGIFGRRQNRSAAERAPGRASILPNPAALTVSHPGDSHEREADRVAERVMGTPPARNQAPRGLDDAPEPASHDLLRSPGHPLEPGARTFMESGFGFDFGKVRIHHDADAGRAASGLSARAFTLGRHIAFGQGQYAPDTPGGRKLLAHELAHVVQHAQNPSPVVRRSPLLKGHGKDEFGDRDAPTIDKALAASPLTKYIPVKDLKTLSGNFETQLPTVFEKQYKDYGQSDEDVDQVPGFVNRAEKKPIKLRLPGKNTKKQIVIAANFEDAVHEVVHLNSKTQFQTNFGHNYNEGVTEYFAEQVLGEPGHAYRDELKLAEGLISALGAGGEELVGKAFFQGEKGLYLSIIDAFRHSKNTGDLLSWQKAYVKKPPDWKTANQLLADVLKGSRTSRSPTPAPSGGSGTSQPPKPEK
jgi:Domain of unknown function (DUF4157)